MITKVYFKKNPIPKVYYCAYPAIINDTTEIQDIDICRDEDDEVLETIDSDNLAKIEFILNEDDD